MSTQNDPISNSELPMSPSPIWDNRALQDLIKGQLPDPVVSRPWQCDVIAAHADLIAKYNDSKQDESLEAKFCNISTAPRRLRDLLWQDFRWLARSEPKLQSLAPRLLILELSGAKVNALAFPMDYEGGRIGVIGFYSPLIMFINSAFSKVWCLTHTYRHAGCIPEFMDRMKSDAYSDTNLLACFYNDVEILFNDQRLYVPFDPPHIADPYDYCEQAEGARRFVLAHELGHFYHVPELNNNGYFRALIERGVPENVAIDWQEELWCDTFAIQVINNNYTEAEIERASPALYELESSLAGILELLFLFDILETFMHHSSVVPLTHPPALVRIENARNVIKAHANYQRSELLRVALNRYWGRFNGFREFVGGANAPLSHYNNWSTSDFQGRLSDYGRAAYRAQFDEVRDRFATLYGFNREQSYSDTRTF